MKNLIYALMLFSSVACASTEPPRVTIKEVTDKDVPLVVETLVKDIGGIVWSMTVLPDERVLVALREGSFKFLDPKTKSVTSIDGAPKVFSEGQGGLLDVALDPDFSKNNYIYYTYSAINGDKQATRLERAKLVGNQLHERTELFTSSPWIDSGYHFGSRIAFDLKGHIYISIGERNKRELAQELNNHYGKVIRLKLNGEVPKDNPFVSNKAAKPEIWSYGHRNPQGLFFDKKTQKLWVSEHGPRGGDEINLVKKGANYGWPKTTYGKEYWGPKITDNVSLPGIEDPRHVWLPSIAPSFIQVYSGTAFKVWEGSFLVGALAFKHLNRVEMKNDKSVAEYRYLVKLDERLRSMALDKVGNILLGSDGGTIYRLVPLTR